MLYFNGLLRPQHMVKRLLDSPCAIIPIEAKWYNQIASGTKCHKWFSRKIGTDYLDKIILMRIMTPDKMSRVVGGAIVLGQHDPLAHRARDVPKKWKFAYKIRCFIPFSQCRYFTCTTFANGTPKWVKEKDVLSSTKRALESYCGMRSDE